MLYICDVKHLCCIGMDFLFQLIKMMSKCGGLCPSNLDACSDPSCKELLYAIKFMVERSLFFNPECVDCRHKTMVSAQDLYVRKSKKVIKDYVNGKKNIKIDRDGNEKVRETISELTGHIVSSGQRNTLKFCNISHIWGNASDPCYFTSLWNIVLIPSYCNALMDKSGGYSEEIKFVYRSICNSLYCPDDKVRELNEHLEEESSLPSMHIPTKTKLNITHNEGSYFKVSAAGISVDVNLQFITELKATCQSMKKAK